MLEKVLKDTSVFVGAGWGAATKDISGNHLDEYRRSLKLLGRQKFNPSERELQTQLLSMASSAMDKSALMHEDLITLPWSRTKVDLPRLASYLMAFTNDHGFETTEEFFPVDLMLQYLRSLHDQYDDEQKAGIPDQFSLALQFTQHNPIAASILTHSAYRAIARISDTRISDKLNFPVQDTENEESAILSMLSMARRTKDFSNESDMDPLGNTYHFWSQFTAAAVFSLEKTNHPHQSNFYSSLFQNAPEITQIIRERIRGKHHHFGFHSEVDMQGLRIGRAVGGLLKNKHERLCTHGPNQLQGSLFLYPLRM